MTDQHLQAMLPTNQQIAEWESQYFDGERQNFDVMMIEAFQTGADCQLEQVLEWLGKKGLHRYVYGDSLLVATIDSDEVIADLKKAMRPQENN